MKPTAAPPPTASTLLFAINPKRRMKPRTIRIILISVATLGVVFIGYLLRENDRLMRDRNKALSHIIYCHEREMSRIHDLPQDDKTKRLFRYHADVSYGAYSALRNSGYPMRDLPAFPDEDSPTKP